MSHRQAHSSHVLESWLWVQFGKNNTKLARPGCANCAPMAQAQNFGIISGKLALGTTTPTLQEEALAGDERTAELGVYKEIVLGQARDDILLGWVLILCDLDT